ncbi:MAG: hypothetical protein ACRDBM_05270 [Sporomusa sp.]
MICDDCQKETACVHVTKIIDQQKIERHLCEQCAQKSGEIIGKGIINLFGSKLSVHDFLKEMFNYSALDTARKSLEPVCADCGLSYSEFSLSGKLGCSGCYQTFSGQLEPLIKRIHGTAAHNGKKPKRSGIRFGVEQRLKLLRHELEQRVSREEYEIAAPLRDEIKDLEKRLVDPDSGYNQG